MGPGSMATASLLSLHMFPVALASVRLTFATQRGQHICERTHKNAWKIDGRNGQGEDIYLFTEPTFRRTPAAFPPTFQSWVPTQRCSVSELLAVRYTVSGAWWSIVLNVAWRLSTIGLKVIRCLRPLTIPTTSLLRKDICWCTDIINQIQIDPISHSYTRLCRSLIDFTRSG